MDNMIECGTCGYPLTPEERIGLVEHNGKMVKPWFGLTDEEMVKDMKDNCDSYEMRGAFVNGWKSAEVKLKEKNNG